MNRQPASGREPEIIPPDKTTSKARIWVSIDAPGSRRAYIRTPGPLGVVVAILVFGILLGAILIILLSALLIWIPIAIVLVVALVVATRLRTHFQRLR